MTHIFVSKITIIGSDNGLAPGRRQAINWTNAGISFIRTVRTNLSEMLNEIHTFSFKNMHLKMSAKWRQFCLGLNVLRNRKVKTYMYMYRVISQHGLWKCNFFIDCGKDIFKIYIRRCSWAKYGVSFVNVFGEKQNYSVNVFNVYISMAQCKTAISIANTLEILQSCTKPSICIFIFMGPTPQVSGLTQIGVFYWPCSSLEHTRVKMSGCPRRCTEIVTRSFKLQVRLPAD